MTDSLRKAAEAAVEACEKISAQAHAFPLSSGPDEDQRMLENIICLAESAAQALTRALEAGESAGEPSFHSDEAVNRREQIAAGAAGRANDSV